MPKYHLYLMGSAGHVERVEEVMALDDDEAVAAAFRHGDQRRALWCGARLVGEWTIAPSPHVDVST